MKILLDEVTCLFTVDGVAYHVTPKEASILGRVMPFDVNQIVPTHLTAKDAAQLRGVLLDIKRMMLVLVGRGYYRLMITREAVAAKIYLSRVSNSVELGMLSRDTEAARLKTAILYEYLLGLPLPEGHAEAVEELRAEYVRRGYVDGEVAK